MRERACDAVRWIGGGLGGSLVALTLTPSLDLTLPYPYPLSP